MLRIDTNLLINRPVNEVWDYFLNTEKTPSWVYGLKAMHKITEGPIGIGTQYTWDIFLFGKEIEQTVEVVNFEPHTLFAFKVIIGGNALYNYTFEPVANGTNLTMHAELVPEPTVTLPEPIFLSLFRRYIQCNLENLKDFIELEALVPA